MPEAEYDVAAANDCAEGAMCTVEIDGTKILLVRRGDTIHAVGAECPHAGAPLVQGVLHGDQVICPWHKAAFCLHTGARAEPPAVDSLPRYQTRIENGRVKVMLPETHPPVQHETAATDSRCFVIVGGGAAGAMAAQTLRQEGFRGRVVMLDRENRVPYDRTLLSKYVLSGEQGGEKSPLQSQSFYREQRIERQTADVRNIDVRNRRITCADGSVRSYDAALLATGGAPSRPKIPGAEKAFLLRSRADADAILARAEQSERAVVLGASFIGMEVAASLRERGLEVTVVAGDSAPFEKQLGARIGGVFTRLHEQHGVAFRFGEKVANIGDATVTLESGEQLPADIAVIGFGVKPVTDYLDSAHRNDDGSIDVNANLRMADGLYAAGDIARFPLHGDGPPTRVEHWRVALQQGRVAALNMLGHDVRYDSAPVFWTIQYLKRLDYIGHASGTDDLVVHGDLDAPKFLAYYVRDNKVAAAIGFDRDTDTAALVALFNARQDWSAAELGENPAAVLAQQSRPNAAR